MEERFRAVMILHALGDTIGFKNGDWEFNYHDREKMEVLDYVNELIYEFIELGGVNGIDLSKWKVSDDTFFHIAMAKAMLKFKGKVSESFIYKLKINMIIEAVKIWNDAAGERPDRNDPNKMVKIEKINRYIGITTSEYIKRFTKKTDARSFRYDDYAGGNGAAMRTLVIGMCLRGKKNRDNLIDLSVVSSQLTHNNALGYLGGFTAALFTALAFENVEVIKWPYILLEYLRSEKLKSYLSLENLENQVYDHNMFIRHWQKYVDTRFDDNKEPIRTRSTANPMHRIRYYHENFYKDTPSYQIGSSGYLCMIMAYDALLDCDGKWEKLIIYSILHSGDSDTIGAIAGGLYGAVYGFGDVPEKMMEHIERKKDLEVLAKDLFKKYSE